MLNPPREATRNTPVQPTIPTEMLNEFRKNWKSLPPGGSIHLETLVPPFMVHVTVQGLEDAEQIDLEQYIQRRLQLGGVTTPIPVFVTDQTVKVYVLSPPHSPLLRAICPEPETMDDATPTRKTTGTAPMPTTGPSDAGSVTGASTGPASGPSTTTPRTQSTGGPMMDFFERRLKRALCRAERRRPVVVVFKGAGPSREWLAKWEAEAKRSLDDAMRRVADQVIREAKADRRPLDAGTTWATGDAPDVYNDIQDARRAVAGQGFQPATKQMYGADPETGEPVLVGAYKGWAERAAETLLAGDRAWEASLQRRAIKTVEEPSMAAIEPLPETNEITKLEQMRTRVHALEAENQALAQALGNEKARRIEAEAHTERLSLDRRVYG